MDAIQAIDGTVSATLDAVRALLSGDVFAPAETTPLPGLADLASTGHDQAVSASDTGTDVVRAEASSMSASVRPDTTPTSDGRATLAALAAETQGPSNATDRQGLTQAVTTGIQPPKAAHSPPSPQSHDSAAPHATPVQPSPQIAVQPAKQASVAATARAGTVGSQNALGMAATGSTMASVQAGGQETTWRSMNVRADVDTAAASRPLDSQVLPTPTSPLHTQAAELQRATHLPNLAAGVREDDTGDAWRDESMQDDEAADDAAQCEATDDDAHAADPLVFANDPDYTTLRQWLADAEQHVALRELDTYRRVILIVPGEPQPSRHTTTRMHLLSPHGADVANAGGDAHSFAARWWPGKGVRLEWATWRLHREAGIAATGQFQSRHPPPMPTDACALLLRLGPKPPSLLDTGSACLDVADQHRFQKALGSQWSVLALLCPGSLCASR